MNPALNLLIAAVVMCLVVVVVCEWIAPMLAPEETRVRRRIH
jgi:lipopolysaccharide export LptBFGC system permease protein LptF